MNSMCRMFAILLMALTGCGQVNPGPGTGNQGATIDPSGPQKTVFDFLQAVRTGNEELIASLLTPLARQKTEEMGMTIMLPNSPQATFQVGDAEYLTAGRDAAHVWSQWTDVDETHASSSYEVMWALRKESVGWRIAGMMTKVFADQPPLVLNFEDPEDMIRKRELLDREMEPEASDMVPEGAPGQANLPPSSQTRDSYTPGLFH